MLKYSNHSNSQTQFNLQEHKFEFMYKPKLVKATGQNSWKRSNFIGTIKDICFADWNGLSGMETFKKYRIDLKHSK